MTLFEKIIARQIPAQIVHETDRVIAFRDIHPVAPVHVLVVPKRPLRNTAEASPEDEALLGHLMLVAAEVARAEGIAGSGFRIVVNNGSHAGQTVDHLHLHVLGGRALGWPPG